MAWFRRKGPFAHEMDSFHVDDKRRGDRLPRLVTGTSQAASEGKKTSDLTIAALGITLALICALFPWYIFLNQESFGVRPMKFEGGGKPTSGLAAYGPQSQRVGAPMDLPEIPIDDLDLFATGTIPDSATRERERSEEKRVDEQPYPAEVPEFRLVHVANGRAMVADDAGLWIVQPGSQLPDSSVVASIEKRKGKWVLVTSGDRVIEMTP
jgi:hypothetical protein